MSYLCISSNLQQLRKRTSYVERLNTSRTVVEFQRKKHSASGDALWQNQTKHIRKRNMSVSMRSIDIREANDPPKSAKVLAGQDRGCKNGLGDTNSFNKRSEKEWFKEESRAPKNVHRRTDSEIEQLVVNVRKSLMEGKTEDTKYRCIGAVEIQFRMHKLGYSEDKTPSLSTIKHIIKRNGLVVQKRKRYIRCKSKKRYTLLNPTKANDIHQMDFVGPRYIKGYGAISSLNLIDVVSSKAHIQQYAGQTMDNVLEFLLSCWTKNAIPNYLQMDNGAYFIGDLIHSRHFSCVVRLCLHLGVEPVFIAPSKPWMNGTIEDFNGDFGKSYGNENNGRIWNTFGARRKFS